MLYNFVVFVEYFTIIGLFIESWIALRKWGSKLHSYLFFSCEVNLVYNAGVLLELRSKTKEEYLAALKLGYLGRIWIGFALFLFIAELIRIHIPTIVTGLLGLTHAIIYSSIINMENNKLYYKTMYFTIQEGFPRLPHTGGILYTVLTVLNAGYTVFGILMIVVAFIKEKNETAKKRDLVMVFAIGAVAISYIVYMTKIVALANKFDVMVFGFAICTVLMLYAIFKYKMLDPRTVAKDYVVDELSEGIIVVDSEDKVSFYNKPAQKLYPELAGSMMLDGRPEDVITIINRAMKEEEPIRMDGRIYTPTVNPLEQNGTNLGTVYALIDETEHYRYLEDLRMQKQRADDANKAKSLFLANMSHEIRTPINAILGMDEMVLRESKDEEITKYAEDIRSSGKTLLAIINDILDFTKVEEGKMEIIPVQYEPGVMKNDLVNMMTDRAARKGLSFNVEFDTDIPRLLNGDEIRIKQCALNLLTNAVKYTEKGKVELKIGYEKEDDDHIVLKFEISDTGAGIKPEDMEDLFSPFTRIEEKKNRSIEGTGLGISITKRLLDLMGGELTAESEYGKGSVFSFTVRQDVLDWEPVGKIGNASGRKGAYKELFHAPDARILIVDDIKMNLTVTTKLLARTKMQIDTARSGPEAIKLAAENTYDIIFIDHLMPEMDGIETLQYMKEQEKDPKPVYIVLTANAISGAREMYLNAGFADYITKPVEGERLERLIMGYLPAEKLLDTPDSV